MKMIEFQQRSENGGFPVPNGNGIFEHGELVMVVSKAGLRNLLETTIPFIDDRAWSSYLNDLLQELKRHPR